MGTKNTGAKKLLVQGTGIWAETDTAMLKLATEAGSWYGTGSKGKHNTVTRRTVKITPVAVQSTPVCCLLVSSVSIISPQCKINMRQPIAGTRYLALTAISVF